MQNLADLKCKIKFLSHMPTEKFCALFPTIEPFFTHDFSPKLLITVGLFWTNLDIFSSICSCRFVIAICWKLLFLVFFSGQSEGGPAWSFLSLRFPRLLCWVPPCLLDPLHQQVFIGINKCISWQQLGRCLVWIEQNNFLLKTKI